MKKQQIMKAAWEIARKGARQFGGSAKEYFAEALKLAWKIARDGSSFKLINYGTKEWKNYGKHRLYINGEMEVLVKSWGKVVTRFVKFRGYYDFDKNVYVREQGKENYRDEIFAAMKMIKKGAVA